MAQSSSAPLLHLDSTWPRSAVVPYAWHAAGGRVASSPPAHAVVQLPGGALAAVALAPALPASAAVALACAELARHDATAGVVVDWARVARRAAALRSLGVEEGSCVLHLAAAAAATGRAVHALQPPPGIVDYGAQLPRTQRFAIQGCGLKPLYVLCWGAGFAALVPLLSPPVAVCGRRVAAEPPLTPATETCDEAPAAASPERPASAAASSDSDDDGGCNEAASLAAAALRAQLTRLARLAESAPPTAQLLQQLREGLLHADEHAAEAEEALQPPAPDAPRLRKKRALDADFVAMPCSVFRASDPRWLAAKRRWGALGLNDSVGRDKDLLHGRSAGPGGFTINGATTSQFCPQLADVCYHLFCPMPREVYRPRVLDACGGGPTRGFVAAARGLDFTCIEARLEQVEANREHTAELLSDDAPQPRYVHGDGRQARQLLRGQEGTFDMIFMCPPYYNLERYSKQADDLSTCATPEAFEAGLTELVAAACPFLKPDRFAVVVAGTVRDRRPGRGDELIDVPGMLIRAFRAAGLHLYNDNVYVRHFGSASRWLRRTYELGGAKLQSVHERVLVFRKPAPGVPPQGAVERLHLSPAPRRTTRTRRFADDLAAALEVNYDET